MLPEKIKKQNCFYPLRNIWIIINLRNSFCSVRNIWIVINLRNSFSSDHMTIDYYNTSFHQYHIQFPNSFEDDYIDSADIDGVEMVLEA